MDFLEFLKSSCYYSDIKFDMRDNMIYKWQTSEYTGFSFYKLSNYEFRVDYCGSATGYTLQHYSSDYHIYKGGSYTNYDLHDSGYGDLRLYYGGSLYGQSEYMKEKEERKNMETSSYSSSTSSSGSSSDGFWSWKTWGVAWAYILGFTFSAGGVLASFLSPYLLIPAPAFMVLWAVLLIIHKIRKK